MRKLLSFLLCILSVGISLSKEAPQMDQSNSLIEDLRQMIGAYDNYSTILRSQILHSKGKTIYLLGPTCSGKSTFINFMMGNVVIPKYGCSQKTGQCALRVKNQKGNPKIGNKLGMSQTSFPQLFCSKDNSQCYVDTPGFMSTMGPLQEIFDSYTNALTFPKSQSINIAVIIQYNAVMSARGQIFRQVMLRIKKIFGDKFQRVLKSTCVVVTKTQTNDIDDLQIKEAIIKIIQGEKENQYIRQIKNLLNQRLYVFPFATKINQQSINKLKKRISSLTKFKVNSQLKLSLSDRSKNTLNQFGDQQYKNFQRLIQQNFKNQSYLTSENASSQYIEKVLQKKSIKELNQTASEELLKEYIKIVNIPSNISTNIVQIWRNFNFLKTFGLREKSKLAQQDLFTRLERVLVDVKQVQRILKQQLQKTLPGALNSAIKGFSIPSLIALASHYGIQFAGFTSSGVGIGSFAAKIQSLIGLVPKHSLFSLLQSIGAKGLILKAAPVVGVVGAVAAVAYYLYNKG